MISTIKIGSITLNDDLNYYLTEVAGLDMPSVRYSSYDVAGEHFAFFVSAFYGKRAFSIRGWVKGSTAADLVVKRDQLEKALDISSGEIPIYINMANGRNLMINAIPTRLDIRSQAGDVNATQFSVSFMAAFPFILGQTENVQSIGLSVSGGGKVIPDTMPMGLNPDSGGSVVVSNNGNGVCYPKVRFNGPVVNPQISNLTTNKAIRLTLTLTAGEYVEIDFKRKSVVDNYGTNRYSSKNGDWWYIQPGGNTIRFTADTYEPTASAVIYSFDSWLGI